MVVLLEEEIAFSRRHLQPHLTRPFVGSRRPSRRVTDICLSSFRAPSMRSSARPRPARRPVRGHTAIRTDAEFRNVVEETEREFAATRAERLERLRGQVRDDVPLEAAEIFFSFIANGLALRLSVRDEPPDLDLLAKLVDEGVAPRPAG
jgi:hypothetical protein